MSASNDPMAEMKKLIHKQSMDATPKAEPERVEQTTKQESEYSRELVNFDLEVKEAVEHMADTIDRMEGLLSSQDYNKAKEFWDITQRMRPDTYYEHKEIESRWTR